MLEKINRNKQLKKLKNIVRLTLHLFIKKEALTRVSRISNSINESNNDYPYKYSNVNCNDVNDNDYLYKIKMQHQLAIMIMTMIMIIIATNHNPTLLTTDHDVEYDWRQKSRIVIGSYG